MNLVQNYVVIYPEAKAMEKEEAEKILGIELPDCEEGCHYWVAGTNVGFIKTTEGDGKEEWYYLRDGKVYRRYRGMAINASWVDTGRVN